jgi:hypothetical protein
VLFEHPAVRPVNSGAKRKEKDSHSVQSRVYRGTSYFDGNHRIEDSHSRLERGEELIFVREDTELTRLDT